MDPSTFSKEPADEPRREDIAGGVGALLRGSGGRLRHQPRLVAGHGDGKLWKSGKKSSWGWVNTYTYHFWGDEHLFTSYFGVHQGYKVLTHCQVAQVGFWVWKHWKLVGF